MNKLRSIIRLTDRIVYEYMNYTTKAISLVVVKTYPKVDERLLDIILGERFIALLYSDCTRYIFPDNINDNHFIDYSAVTFFQGVIPPLGKYPEKITLDTELVNAN